MKDYIENLGYTTTCTFSIKPPNSGILLDVDNDMDILDMMCTLKDGDIVKHLINEAIKGHMLLESGSHVDIGESGSNFNTRPSESDNFNWGVGEDQLNSEDLFAASFPSPTTDGATAGDDDIPHPTIDDATVDGVTAGDDI